MSAKFGKTKKEKPAVIILHGWGLSGAKYSSVVQILQDKGYRVFAPDMPGFGKEPLVSDTMNLDDYVVFLQNFMKKNKIEKPILIGHSFGGRVALKYSTEYPDNVSKIILSGTPVIRHRPLIKRVAFVAATIGGKVFSVFPQRVQKLARKSLYRLLGEWDYYKSGPLSQVFKNIVGEDLVQYAKKNTVSTLLLWGADDKLTPAADVATIKNMMHNASSFIVPNIGHKLPYENPKIFAEKVLQFIQ